MSDPATSFDPTAHETSHGATDSWDELLANLRSRYPGQRDSVLFCIWKLQQNPELTLRDFRAEAEMHGIGLAGRSVHSAKVLLGLADAAPAPRRRHDEAATAAEAGPARSPVGETPPESEALVRGRALARRARTSAEEASLEGQLVEAVRRIQTAANEETHRLRTAIRAAIDVLQRALDQA